MKRRFIEGTCDPRFNIVYEEVQSIVATCVVMSRLTTPSEGHISKELVDYLKSCFWRCKPEDFTDTEPLVPTHVFMSMNDVYSKGVSIEFQTIIESLEVLDTDENLSLISQFTKVNEQYIYSKLKDIICTEEYINKLGNFIYTRI